MDTARPGRPDRIDELVTELEIAEVTARGAHGRQKEKLTGEPYIKHVERVVAMVESEEAKAVAWLHDVLEDTPVSIRKLREAGIGSDTIVALMLLSRAPWETYAEHIDAIKRNAWTEAGKIALEVKLADLRDHLRPNCPESLRERYEKAWAVLAPDQPVPGQEERVRAAVNQLI